ncbi:kelch repeat-containing protein, partial [Elusimicrobiota bacterium]
MGASDLSTGDPIIIGGEPDWGNGNYFTGAIDEMQIRNYALTDREIMRDYLRATHTVEISTDSGDTYYYINASSVSSSARHASNDNEILYAVMGGTATLADGATVQVKFEEGTENIVRATILDVSMTTNTQVYAPNVDLTLPLPPTLSETQISAWTTHAAANLANGAESKYAHTSVVLNNKVYIIGGIFNNSGGLSANIYSADIDGNGSLGSWTELNSTAEVINNRLYVLGGNDSGGGKSDIVYSDINTDGSLAATPATWNLAYMPTIRYMHASVVYNNRIYIIGGYDGSNTLGSVYFAQVNPDGSLGDWTQTTSLPGGALRMNHTSTLFNNRIYVIGGYDESSNVKSDVYSANIKPDGTLSDWTVATSLPAVRRGHTSVVLNNSIYVIGTTAEEEVYYTQVDADGILDDPWTPTASLPDTRGRHTSFVANSNIYSIGGRDAGDSATTTQVFTASVPVSGITVSGGFNVSFTAPEDQSSLSGLHSTPVSIDAYTVSRCTGAPAGSSGWFNGASYLLDTIQGNNTYYLSLKARDTATNVSTNSCFGPYFLYPIVRVSVSSTSATSTYQEEKQALLKFTIYKESDLWASTLSSLVIEKSTDIPDSDITRVYIYKDDGNGIFDADDDSGSGDGVFSGNISTITLTQNMTLLTDPVTYFVVIDPAATAVPTRDISLTITDAANFRVTTPFRPTGNLPYSSQDVTVKDAQSSVTIIPESVWPPQSVSQGATNYPMAKLVVDVDNGTAELSEIVLELAGTDAATSDIGAVKIYRSFNNATFEPDIDTLLGAGETSFVAGSSTYTITASLSDRTIVDLDGTQDAFLFVVYDIAPPAEAGHYVAIRISSSSYFRWVGSSDTTNATNLPFTSEESLVTAPNTMWTIFGDQAPASVLQGDLVVMSTVYMWTDVGTALLAGLNVNNSGDSDSDISNVGIYKDFGDDDVFSGIDSEIKLATAAFDSGLAQLSFTDINITASTETFFVVYQLSPNASIGNYIGMNVVNETRIVVNTGATSKIMIPSPFESSTPTITATQDGLFVKENIGALVPSKTMQGSTNTLAMAFSGTMLTNGGIFRGLQVQIHGNATYEDIDYVKVYVSSDSVFDPGSDGIISSGFDEIQEDNSASIPFVDIQELTTESTKYFFVTVEINANAVVGSTYSLAIMQSGDVQLVGSNDSAVGSFPMNTGGSIWGNTEIEQFPNTVTIEYTDSTAHTGGTVEVGDSMVLIELIRLYSDLNDVTWKTFSVGLTGGANANDVSRVYLHEDTDGNSQFHPLADIVLASNSFTSGSLDMSQLGLTVPYGTSSTGGKKFFVTVDIGTSAVPERQFALNWSNPVLNFEVEAPNSVDGSSNVFSGYVQIKAPPVFVYSSAT